MITAARERIGALSGFWVNTSDGRMIAYRVHPETGLLPRLTNLLKHDTFEVPSEQVQGLGAVAHIVTEVAPSPKENVKHV